MIKEYNIKKVDDNIYEIKESLDKFNYYKEKYQLEYDDKYKEYKINDILIISNNKEIKYYIDKIIKIEENKDKIKINYNRIKISPFSFYKEIDTNDEYDLYKNKNKNINLKKYNNYLIIENNII